nr:hypothetical protein Iba_chr12eCG8510 [Ipomoea batatas]
MRAKAKATKQRRGEVEEKTRARAQAVQQRRFECVEGSDAATGDSGPLDNESGELGRDSGLLEDAELSVGVAGVSSGDSGLFVE